MNKRSTEGFVGCVVLRPRTLLLALLLLLLSVSGVAQTRREPPRSFSQGAKALVEVQRRALSRVDTERLLAEDRRNEKDPRRPVPQRFAVAVNVDITLNNSGSWETLNDGRLWRLRIHSPEAKSHNLGITRFDMPEGAKLWIYDPEQKQVQGPYTSRDRSRKGRLWTPVIEGDEIVVEVFVPTGVREPLIQIGRVNQGYREFSKGGGDKNHGACNNDVICPEGDPWRDQIRSVARYTINGTSLCTGQLMNNINLDRTPYFLSANHCGVTTANDDTLVFFWNFEAPNCGDQDDGNLSDNQTGAIFRASSAASDFLLVELEEDPDPAFNVFFSGWDATGAAPASTVAIHHPRGDVKSISFNTNAVTSTDYLSDTVNAAEDHWRVDDWEDGTTEGGSSGSCLWDAATRRCVGQLHGGSAFCTAQDESDWYGKLSTSWEGGGTTATRLRDWLDPGGTGVLSLDGDPHITADGGLHYDFQGAGEYVSLRKASGTEIQTRMTPISTTFNPGPGSHHGLATCVSINTAAAARVGSRRVTYQPNLSGVPDPSGLQLRVDGALTTLGVSGLDLGNGGRISRTSASGGIRVDFPDGTVLLVTPNWWASQQKWYLNVEVLRVPVVDGMGGDVIKAAGSAPSTQGLMGAVPPGSWLPSLPNGTPMGPMPSSLHQRYVDLYQKFGEAWRVNGSTSLFDYAPGTSTATFTLQSWPPENGPCIVPATPVAEPASEEVARRACRLVKDKNKHDDCVFDVRVTGELGFANIYTATEDVIIANGGTVTPRPGVGDPGGGGTTSPGKWALFLDAGAGVPHGTFSNFFDPGFSFNGGVEYMFTPYVSAEGIFGYHRFPADFGGHLNLYQLSANVKTYFTAPPNQVRPFVNGGIGAYKFGSGSTRFGGNLGAGILFELTPRFGLQGSYNFHMVNTPGVTTRFSTLQGGVRFVF